MLSVEVQQVNEGRGVGEYLKGIVGDKSRLQQQPLNERMPGASSRSMFLSPLNASLACNYTTSYIKNYDGNEIRMGRSEEPEEHRQAWSQLRGCRTGV